MCVNFYQLRKISYTSIPRKKREEQVGKDCKHKRMNNPGINNLRKKQETEKEKWENEARKLS